MPIMDGYEACKQILEIYREYNEKQIRQKDFRSCLGLVLVQAQPSAPAGFEVSDAGVQVFLESIRELRGAGLIQDSRPQFGKASKSVELTLQDGSPITLEFGNSFKFGTENAVYVRGNRDAFLYYLPQGSVTSLESDFSSMGIQKKTASPPSGSIDMSSLSHLPPEAKEQLMRQIQGERRKQEMLKAFEEQNTVRETK